MRKYIAILPKPLINFLKRHFLFSSRVAITPVDN